MDAIYEPESALMAGPQPDRTPQPCIMVIFGASGDLTQRKLMPGLYNLARAGLLPDPFAVVGVARTAMDHDDFRKRMRDAVAKHSRTGGLDPLVWDKFERNLFYAELPAYDDPDNYASLRKMLHTIDDECGTQGNRLFYLSTPPTVAEAIIQRLGRSNMEKGRGPKGWRRIIIEKPFGTDLPSSHDLNRILLQHFDEEEVYRIDHYLGKETVQNLVVLRFANSIFEPIWNRNYVDHVQITVAESVGVEGRGGYYEESGALRDIIQNHGLQLLALTAMEPPVAFDARSVRDEKNKVLRAIHPFPAKDTPNYVARGQYTAGVVGGKTTPGYLEEPGVASKSTTETYVALRLDVDNWRWAGVPFYLRTGKRMPRRVTEIAIQFKLPPLLLFPGAKSDGLRPNVLTINVQPEEGINLQFEAKVPGQFLKMRPVTMNFHYGEAFTEDQPEAYERLILDAILGDATLFTRADEVDAQWRIVQPILDGWPEAPPPEGYASGTWGPACADEFMAQRGREWRKP